MENPNKFEKSEIEIIDELQKNEGVIKRYIEYKLCKPGWVRDRYFHLKQALEGEYKVFSTGLSDEETIKQIKEMEEKLYNLLKSKDLLEQAEGRLKIAIHEKEFFEKQKK